MTAIQRLRSRGGQRLFGNSSSRTPQALLSRSLYASIQTSSPWLYSMTGFGTAMISRTPSIDPIAPARQLPPFQRAPSACLRPHRSWLSSRQPSPLRARSRSSRQSKQSPEPQSGPNMLEQRLQAGMTTSVAVRLAPPAVAVARSAWAAGSCSFVFLAFQSFVSLIRLHPSDDRLRVRGVEAAGPLPLPLRVFPVPRPVTEPVTAPVRAEALLRVTRLPWMVRNLAVALLTLFLPWRERNGDWRGQRGKVVVGRPPRRRRRIVFAVHAAAFGLRSSSAA